MSSYLTIYLQPRKDDESGRKEPMALMAYSRNSDVYETMREELDIAYAGSETCPYTELTTDKMELVVSSQKRTIDSIKRRVGSMRESLKYLSQKNCIDEKLEEIEELERYIEELEGQLEDLRFIATLVSTIKTESCWASFDKALVNIG